MTRRFSYEQAKEIIEGEGYILISKEYVNSSTKLETRCPKNHPYFVSLNLFHSAKTRCTICLGKNTYDIEIVKSFFNENGYTLITKEYERAAKKLDCICPNGHDYSISAYSFIKLGSRCPRCKGIKKYTTQDISEILEKEGYELITKTYRNAHQKLDMICPNRHNVSMAMNWFLSRGSRCQHCADNAPHSLESIKEFVEKEGYVLVSAAYDAQKKIDLICPKGHSYNTSTFYNFKKGRRCPKCTERGSSKAERYLFAIALELYPDTIKKRFYNDPTNHRRFLELDIYVPTLKRAIEYDGTYYHSVEYMMKTKNRDLWSDEAINNYHEDKDSYFASLGIQILRIKEEDWEIDKEDCIKRCLDFLAP
jgi:hypothetical protein